VALFLAGALSSVPVGALAAAVIGLGVLRGLPGWHVAAVALGVTGVPIAGVRALLGGGRWAIVAGAWLWPACALLALPGFFPGEMEGALSTGLAVLAAPGGPEAASRAARIGQAVAAPAAALPTGLPPPPEAERSVPECLPAAGALTGDAVALPFEGRGHSMVIPVQVENQELTMLFDTGASVTTLDERTLRSLGIRVPRDAPEVTLRTANGERTARIVLLEQVWVGGLPVDGVTVGVCEECADERTAGLLGLNVSGQFLVTVDTQRKEVVFQPRTGDGDRLIDVSPWLKVQATARIFPDTRVEVDVEAENQSPRLVLDATVGVQCGDDHFVAHLKDVPSRSVGRTSMSLPRGTACDQYRVSLEHARW
jgi:clan AA aspartic protease (TIGR02281 family)